MSNRGYKYWCKCGFEFFIPTWPHIKRKDTTVQCPECKETVFIKGDKGEGKD